MFAKLCCGKLVHDTRRFDRQSMGSFGATPAPHKAPKGRPNADHRRIVNGILWIDRTGHPGAFAQKVWALEDCCKPFTAEKAGVWDASWRRSRATKRRRGVTGRSFLATIVRALSMRPGQGQNTHEALGYFRVAFRRRCI